MDQLVTEFKSSIAELNRKAAQAELKALPASHKGANHQTFVRCSECHLKQFDFWRQTHHARALQPLIQAKQALNKECIACHSVGFAQATGFTDVTRLAELRPEPGASPSSNVSLSSEELSEYLMSMQKAASVDTPVKIARESTPKPLRETLNAFERSWAPVQCENCHAPGGEHPFSGGYVKTVARETCLQCHTPERAPSWHLPTGPNWELIGQKRAMITCPAGEFEVKAED